MCVVSRRRNTGEEEKEEEKEEDTNEEKIKEKITIYKETINSKY